MAGKFSEQQLQQLWVKAGGDPKVAPMMAKIAIRESGGNPGAQNLKYPDHSIGFWQINQLAHKGRYGDDHKLMDPLANARAAVAVYKLQGPKAWSTYNPAIDKKYIGNVGKVRSAPSTTQRYTNGTPSDTGMDKTALALSLLGVSNDYGVDPLQLAITAAMQKHAAPQPTPSPTYSPKAGKTPNYGGGTTTLDGKPVVGWIADILKKARAAGWHGTVTSGVRTKEQQMSAARNYGLQHYPNGPLASNHVQGHNGAVDVSDPQGLQRALKKLGINKLRNDMPEDPVHFSANGH